MVIVDHPVGKGELSLRLKPSNSLVVVCYLAQLYDKVHYHKTAKFELGKHIHETWNVQNWAHIFIFHLCIFVALIASLRNLRVTLKSDIVDWIIVIFNSILGNQLLSVKIRFILNFICIEHFASYKSLAYLY